MFTLSKLWYILHKLDCILAKPESEIQEEQVHEVLVFHKHQVSRNANISFLARQAPVYPTTNPWLFF
jgi:hypothetical protein